MRGRALVAHGFNTKSLEKIGDQAFTIVEGALVPSFECGRCASVSDDRVLTFLDGPDRTAESRLGRISTTNALETGIEGLANDNDAGTFSAVAVSPDGRFASVMRQDSDGVASIRLRDIAGGFEQPYKGDGIVLNVRPVLFSADGDRLAYTLNESPPYEITIAQVDPSMRLEVTHRDQEPIFLSQWTEDDRIVFTRRPIDSTSKSDICFVERDGESGWREKIRVFGPGDIDYDRSFGQISPDGNWIAYVSNQTENSEVWVARFPSGQGRVKISDGRISTAQAQQPRWLSGSTLIYLQGTGARLAIIQAELLLLDGASAELRELKTLSRERINKIVPEYGSYFYDVRRKEDGTPELIISFIDSTEDPVLHVLLNWQDIVGPNRGSR